MPQILVRPPSPRLADGELTHLDRQPVDPDLALRQWHGYVAAFADRGWQVTAVVALDEETVLMSAGAPRTAELFAARG